MYKTKYLKGTRLERWLHAQFLEKKLDSVFGYILLFVLSVIMAYGIAQVDRRIGPAIVLLAIVFVACIAIVRKPYFGFYFLIVFSSITVTLYRIVELPIPPGIIVELLTYLIALNILLKKDLKKSVDLQFWLNPMTVAMYGLFAYYIIELFNPEMDSFLGWFSYFKRQFSYFIFYFICYSLLNTRKRIIYFVRFIIAFSAILALYACKQQWFGYAGFELRAIGTGDGFTLLFQGGFLRKFSVFSDPSTSGILFASVAMLCTVLLVRSESKIERRWLAAALIFNLLGYSYSGTRTATLMLIAGVLLYFLATLYDRRTIIFMVYTIVGFVFLMFAPVQTAVVYRIRSTFEGTKDASASVRDYDRHEVQPYIQAHPLGGGIFTAGAEGFKYNKGHYLEFLQPDSGYMKVMAEQGAIGLAFLLIFYFIIMRFGIKQFFNAQDPEIRTYYIGLLVMMFTLLVAQYSQMAITQYPIVLLFYASMVIFIRLKDFDKSERSLQTHEN